MSIKLKSYINSLPPNTNDILWGEQNIESFRPTIPNAFLENRFEFVDVGWDARKVELGEKEREEGGKEEIVEEGSESIDVKREEDAIV